MSEDELRITVGWRYLVHSQGGADKDLVSSGTFIGYTALGQDTAMVIELDQGPEGGPKKESDYSGGGHTLLGTSRASLFHVRKGKG